MKYSTFFIIFGILGFLLLGFMHENVHQEIFRSYGIESHIEVKFPHLVTVSEPYYPSQCPDSCTLAHNINEAITYPLTAFYLLFYVGLLTVIVILENGKS